MSVLRWLSALLLALAVVAGAALWLQRQAAAQLRDEIALLSAESRQLAGLRAENSKLTGAQVSAAELERLRADRAAVVQLRGEIEKLKAGVAERENALKLKPMAAAANAVLEESEPVPAPHVLPIDQLKNAGRATPLATLETILWAGTSGDFSALARTLIFDKNTATRAQEMFDGLSEAQRREYGSWQRMIAMLMAKDMPVGEALVAEVKSLDPDPITAKLNAELKDKDGETSTARFEFQKVGAQWSLKVPGKTMEHFSEVLHDAPLTK